MTVNDIVYINSVVFYLIQFDNVKYAMRNSTALVKVV